MTASTVTVTFSPEPLARGRSIEPPSQDTIKGTPSLWNADPDDAARFGGELTRAALGACRFRGDRRYIVVDTKIHMLLPGMLPAIPGWHTDGVPRDPSGNPSGKGPPLLDLQVALDAHARRTEETVAEHNEAVAGRADEVRAAAARRSLGDYDPAIYRTTFGTSVRPPRYHLLVTGGDAPTEFLTEPWTAMFPTGEVPDLYNRMTRLVEADRQKRMQPRSAYAADAQVYEFGWWDVHRAIPARAFGWRFLMRATETDSIEPQTDLRQIIRLHNPVYVTETYGW